MTSWITILYITNKIFKQVLTVFKLSQLFEQSFCNIHFTMYYTLKGQLIAYESHTNCVLLNVHCMYWWYHVFWNKAHGQHGCPNMANNLVLRWFMQYVECKLFLPCFQIVFQHVDVISIFPFSRKILSWKFTTIYAWKLVTCISFWIRYCLHINNKTTPYSSSNWYRHFEAHLNVLYRHLLKRVKLHSIGILSSILYFTGFILLVTCIV